MTIDLPSGVKFGGNLAPALFLHYSPSTAGLAAAPTTTMINSKFREQRSPNKRDMIDKKGQRHLDFNRFFYADDACD
jgi:hypothetical protein